MSLYDPVCVLYYDCLYSASHRMSSGVSSSESSSSSKKRVVPLRVRVSPLIKLLTLFLDPTLSKGESIWWEGTPGFHP